MFTVASLSGGTMNEVYIYICLSYVLQVFYNKQYLFLLLKNIVYYFICISSFSISALCIYL